MAEWQCAGLQIPFRWFDSILRLQGNMKKVGFKALIQEVKTKSLRTGDRSTRITLEVDAPDDNLLKALAELQRADAYVGVAIAESVDG